MRASFTKRVTTSWEEASSGFKSLSATSRPKRSSRAQNTVLMPPSPMPSPTR
jgi:hypothetical protein